MLSGLVGTRSRTDEEAWRARIDAKRAEAARRRELEQAARTAKPVPAPRPSAERATTQVPSQRHAPDPDRVGPADGTARASKGTDGGRIDVEEAVRLYRLGHPLADVAAKVGASRSTVAAHLRQAGVEVRPQGQRLNPPQGSGPKVYPADLVAAVRRMAPDRTQAEMAAELGCSQKVVWNLMRNHRIAARAAKPRSAADGAASLKATMAAHGLAAATVRRWARDTGRDCPSRGLPPAWLVQEYLDAHTA